MTRLVAPLARPWGAVLTAALLVAAVTGAGLLLRPTPTVVTTTPVVEPVASSELLCPITVATSTLVSTVSAGVAPVPGVADGLAALSALQKGGAAPLPVEGPGSVVTDTITGKAAPPRSARATGSWSAGFGADQTARSGQGPTRGLAAGPCARPVTEGWLVGGASTVGRATQVLLVNDDDRAAQVDLVVYGTQGEIASPAGSGVVVPPLSRSIVRLEALAPGQEVTAVHVLARSGRIAAAALETAANGLIPQGMAVLPLTHAARSVVIPDVPPAATVRLLLLAPTAAATATVQVLTPDGAITAAGLESVNLDAGKLVSLDLSPAQAGQYSGVLVTSDAPVVAAVTVSTGRRGQYTEIDATAGTPELTAPGVVVGLDTGTWEHVVGLAAPGTATRVRLDLYVGSAAAPAWTTTVELAAGSTSRITVPVTTNGSLLVVTPLGAGPLYVTRELTEKGPRGPMIALAPVLPTRATTTVPPVVSVPGSSQS